MAGPAKIPAQEFDRILGRIVREEGAAVLLVPGVYEACSEHFNNDVLDAWAEEQQAAGSEAP